MPIGCIGAVPHVVLDLVSLSPKSVLDLGIGMGFYGAAIRQWVDLGYKNNFKTLIHGVESFRGYENPCWSLYNKVFIRDMGDLLLLPNWPLLDQYDAIIMADVIEHFDKSEGYHLLEAAFRRLAPAGRLYLVTPSVFVDQGAVYGNPAEEHRSLWDLTDFDHPIRVPSTHDGTVQVKILQDGTVDQFGSQTFTVVYTKS